MNTRLIGWKNVLASKGFMGGLATAIIAALGFILGVDFEKDVAEQLSVVLVSVGTFVGGVISAYGRYKAKNRLS